MNYKTIFLLLVLLSIQYSCSVIDNSKVLPNLNDKIAGYEEFEIEYEPDRFTRYKDDIFIASTDKGFSSDDFIIQTFNRDSNKFETVNKIQSTSRYESIVDLYIQNDTIHLITKFSSPYNTFKMNLFDMSGNSLDSYLIFTVGDRKTIYDDGYFFEDDEIYVTDSIFFEETYLQNSDIDLETRVSILKRSENNKYIAILSKTTDEDENVYIHYSVMDLNGQIIHKNEKQINLDVATEDNSTNGMTNLSDDISFDLNKVILNNSGEIIYSGMVIDENSGQGVLIAENLIKERSFNKSIDAYMSDLEVTNIEILKFKGNNLLLAQLLDGEELKNILYVIFDDNYKVKEFHSIEVTEDLVSKYLEDNEIRSLFVTNYLIDDNDVYLILENQGINTQTVKELNSSSYETVITGFNVEEKYLVKINSDKEIENILLLNSEGKNFGLFESYPFNFNYPLFNTIHSNELSDKGDNLEILIDVFDENKAGLNSIEISKSGMKVQNSEVIFKYEGNGYLSLLLTEKIDNNYYSIVKTKGGLKLAKYEYK